MTTNQAILNKLLIAKNKLSPEASNLIRSFLKSKMHTDGGFIDRSGTDDPYYSVFGYTLTYVFDIESEISREVAFLQRWEEKNDIDFVHAISLVRCYYLLEAIKWSNLLGKFSKSLAKATFIQKIVGKKIANKLRKEHKQLLKIITNYKATDQGFNHLKTSAENASVYANFLVYGLFEDLYFSKNWRKKIVESCNILRIENGSFVNHPQSKHGVSSTTAAGIVLLNSQKYAIFDSVNWLKEQILPNGGFLAGEDVPVADVLSTATSMFALNITNSIDSKIKSNAIEFINMHWDDSGGFFGSIADQIPDVEYTFYGLLAIGC